MRKVIALSYIYQSCKPNRNSLAFFFFFFEKFSEFGACRVFIYLYPMADSRMKGHCELPDKTWVESKVSCGTPSVWSPNLAVAVSPKEIHLP